MQPNVKPVLNKQHELVNQVFKLSLQSHSPLSAEDIGLRIYQHNLLMTATRSLSITYPVIEKMIGEESLIVLAKRLLRIEMPDSGDWADWGIGLFGVLQHSELHQEHPYLTDIAKLEWAVHQASKARKVEFDTSSIHRLGDGNLEQVHIRLAPDLQLLTSEFPVHSLWQAHQPKVPDYLPNEDTLVSILTDFTSQHVAVFQWQGMPQVTHLSRAEYDWLTAIKKGSNLDQLFDLYPDFDFVPWLSEAISQGWIETLN